MSETASAAVATSAPVTTDASSAATGTTAPAGQAPATAASPKGASETPRLFNVKVDGKVVQMTEAQLMEAASLGKTAFRRMEEAAHIRRQNEAFIEKFRKDPMAALEDPALGLSEAQRREAIEKYYANKYIEQDKLTPEQRKLQEVQRELEGYKQKEEEGKKAAEAEQRKQLVGQYQEHYTKIITEALDKSGLPKTPQTIGRMAFYMSQAARNKVNAPMEMIVDRVRQDYQEAFQALTQSSPAEALINFLGPEVAKKIQRHALDQHKKKLSESATPRSEEPVRPRERKTRESDAEGWKKVSQYWTRHSK